MFAFPLFSEVVPPIALRGFAPCALPLCDSGGSIVEEVLDAFVVGCFVLGRRVEFGCVEGFEFLEVSNVLFVALYVFVVTFDVVAKVGLDLFELCLLLFGGV